MTNEPYLEKLELNEMCIKVAENDFGYVSGRSDTGNFFDLKRWLANMNKKSLPCQLDDMSVKNSGHSDLDDLITFFWSSNTAFIVECKKLIRQHQSVNKDRSAKYAADGVLFYAKHLKNRTRCSGCRR